MKKNLLVLAGLFVANAALATHFGNGTNFDLRIQGRGGLWYTVGTERESVSGEKSPASTRRFETGVQDNLVIKVGNLYKGNLQPVPGAPTSLRFYLVELKKYFASIDEVHLNQSGSERTHDLEFKLSIIGKPREDIDSIKRKLMGSLHLRTVGYCKIPGTPKWRCSVNRSSNNLKLYIENITPLQLMNSQGKWINVE
jgi:hypothetical protein